jgi:hypothetical protein
VTDHSAASLYRRLLLSLDVVFSFILVGGAFAFYFVVGWWTLVLVPTYMLGALAMGVYARVPFR